MGISFSLRYRPLILMTTTWSPKLCVGAVPFIFINLLNPKNSERHKNRGFIGV